MSDLQISRDALLNEYKGNLFEFLVCIEIASKFDLLNNFYHDLNPSAQKMLEQQESFLRNYYPYLIVELPKLAHQSVQSLVDNITIESVQNVSMIGKSMSSHKLENFSEEDIVIKTSDRDLRISLKMAKSGSFVNSKSAGLRSFFTKYFSDFDSNHLQNDFNEFCKREFEMTSYELHREVGLEYSGDFKLWEDNHYPVLPGKLDQNLKEILYVFYEKVNDFLFDSMTHFFQTKPLVLSQMLNRLKGYSSDDLIQLTAFYKLKDDKFVDCHFLTQTLEASDPIVKIVKKSKVLDIYFQNSILQIRVKPMNKFTSKSFKINCAVKYF